MKNKKSNKIQNLQQIPDYLSAVIAGRFKSYFQDTDKDFNLEAIPIPSFEKDRSAFSTFLSQNILTPEEFLTLSIALIPHLLPGFLSQNISAQMSKSGDYPEIGGVKGSDNRGFLPTGETVLFLIAGVNISKRKEALSLFSQDHWFTKKGVLHLEDVQTGASKTSGKLILDPEYVELFLTEKIAPPKLSTSFPAQRLSTEQTWNDLILPSQTFHEIEEIKTWVEHHATLMNDWGLSKKVKPGYRAFFYGPPGTGKTLTATLIGKHTNKEVFRIDLSSIVSKFIGETEKNLSALFDKAENKNWILFFDEADALFGKRTTVRDAHDKYANQEVSYLLQRVESFSGLVILASNFKTNIDEAFIRRFQSIIYFPKPSAEERFKLWSNTFPKQVTLEPSIDLENIAQKFELTGANIINIVQYTCLQALSRNETEVTLSSLNRGIRREFQKEGKIT